MCALESVHYWVCYSFLILSSLLFLLYIFVPLVATYFFLPPNRNLVKVAIVFCSLSSLFSWYFVCGEIESLVVCWQVPGAYFADFTGRSVFQWYCCEKFRARWYRISWTVYCSFFWNFFLVLLALYEFLPTCNLNCLCIFDHM